MSQFVILMTLADGSAEGLPDGHAALGQAVAQEAERQDGRLLNLLWTSGEYDGVALLELPDDRRAAAIAIQLGQAGLHTKTLTAFDEDAMGEIAGHIRGGHIRGGHIRGGHIRGGAAQGD